MHLEQPIFIYSVCGPFNKNKKRIKKAMQKEDTSYFYNNDLDKA